MINQGINPPVFHQANDMHVIKSENVTMSSIEDEQLLRKGVYTQVKLSEVPQSTRLID